MSLTIEEILWNGDYNLQNPNISAMSIRIGTEQVHNAKVLLEKGYKLTDCGTDLLDKYDKVEDVPENPNKDD